MMISRYPRFFFSFLLFTLALGIFWPGLPGGFLLDDNHAIQHNSALDMAAFNLENLRLAAESFAAGGRQLPMLSFAFNHMAGGLDPWGYKLTGLVIHALNAILVYCVLLRILIISGIDGKKGSTGAFLLALTWAAHPLQVSTALYVVQRMETMSCFFVFLGILAYIKGREKQMSGTRAWPWLIMALFAAAPGLLCKESAALFPVYCLALELTVLNFRAQSRITERGLRYFYGLATVLALILFLVFAMKHYSATTIAGRNFNTLERLLTQLRVLVMYLQQIVIPLPQSMTFYYDHMEVSTGFLTPWTTAASGLLLSALLLSAWFARNRYPLFALGVFWFLAGHLLTSNVIALEMVYEHRNYFALLGVLLAIAEILTRIPIRRAIKHAGIATLVVGVLSMGFIRADAWGNSLMLALDMAAINPDSPRAAVDLGNAYYRASRGNPKSPYFQAAEQTFDRASAMPNASAIPATNLLVMNSIKGEKNPPYKYWDRLDNYIKNSAITPESRSAIYNLLEKRLAEKIIVDDARLSQALDRMNDHFPLPAIINLKTGIHALKFLSDHETGKKHLLLAMEKGRNNPKAINTIIVTALRFGLMDVVSSASRYLPEYKHQ
jgi:hypothetical protein